MRPQDIALCTAKRFPADVAQPQLATYARHDCHFAPDSAKLCADRTQAVYLLKRGLRGKIAPTFQEYWSRGCLRAHALFLRFAWLPLWQHVLRKKKKSYLLKSRYQPSQPILANTSNLLRRAGWGNLARHAASLRNGPKQAHSSEIDCDFACHQGSLVRLILVLTTAAVPLMQDRSLC